MGLTELAVQFPYCIVYTSPHRDDEPLALFFSEAAAALSLKVFRNLYGDLVRVVPTTDACRHMFKEGAWD